MDKRVAPRRPGSRDGSFPSPSSSFSPSSSSSSTSMRSTDSDSLPPSIMSRPGSSSSSIRPHSPNSRPHSPTTLPPIVSPPIVSPSTSYPSPLGSPLVKRRSITSPALVPLDGTFLTSLRGANGIGNHTEPEVVTESQEYTESNHIFEHLNGEIASENGNGNGADDESTHDPEALARVDAEQAARRAELDSYMSELQSKKDVVIFPKHFTELLETIESDQAAITDFWAKFMVDPQIDNPWLEDEQLAKGLERIRKLDILLAKKTKQARELKKALQPSKPTKEEKEKEKAKPIPAPPQLTQVDEKRLEALLMEETPNNTNSTSNNPSPHEELHTPFDELEDLYELDVKLAQIVDVSEWELKGLAHLRPTSASSRASYASYASRSSNASRVSYISSASRASSSMSGQLLTELEKEEAERDAADKARLREIDARLRELSSADAGGDADDPANAQPPKAPPEEIRKLVRMYSTSSVPPPLV